MLSVCYDTSTPAVSVAVGDERGVLATLEVREGRRHAETLLPATDALLRMVQRERHELTHVGVDVGPGLFTGLRVGVATAKGLSLALGVAVVPVTSLELLAAGAVAAGAVAADGVAADGGAGRVIAVLDARRGELYAATFDIRNGEPVPVASAFVAPLAEAIERCGSFDGALVVGDVAVLPSAVAASAAAVVAARPDAPALAVFLAGEHRAGRLGARAVPGDHVELAYLRASDAELAASKAAP